MMGVRSTAAGVLAVFLCGCSPAHESKPAAPPAAEAGAASSSTAPASVVGRASRRAIVSLEPTTPREFPAPQGPVVMDQYGRAFVPDLLIARVGQPVEFRNSEDVQHNVRVERSPTGTMVFSETREPFDKFNHTFMEPGDFDVICDIHPGMRAAIHVTRSPFAVTADDGGAFTIADVPPGSYKVTVITPDRKRSERVIEVKGPRTDITFP